jgi:hypothetical protein
MHAEVGLLIEVQHPDGTYGTTGRHLRNIGPNMIQTIERSILKVPALLMYRLQCRPESNY